MLCCLSQWCKVSIYVDSQLVGYEKVTLYPIIVPLLFVLCVDNIGMPALINIFFPGEI